MQLASAWAEHGLSDEMASIIEGIILGDGWAGAGAWKDKWRKIKPVNMLGCMNTLATRDDVTCQARPDSRSRPWSCTATRTRRFRAQPGREAHRRAAPTQNWWSSPGGGHASNLTHADVVETRRSRRFWTDWAKRSETPPPSRRTSCAAPPPPFPLRFTGQEQGCAASLLPREAGGCGRPR